MRVLQLIDSLDIGGAERVAVNFANALVNRIDKSYLCTTRKEGALKNTLKKEVVFLFLNKKKVLDFRAIKQLSAFVRKNKIEIIHAHASSFFSATLVKILNPDLKLIWHEHYGNRNKTSKFNQLILKISSLFFNKILVVSEKLKTWCENNLFINDVQYFSNYVVDNQSESKTVLKGSSNKRIICIANLKADKDHLNLLKAFKLLCDKNTGWTLHLVGKIFNDAYYESITNYIHSEKISDLVFLYNSCQDVSNILSQSSIGVLSSKSEGLPLSLLEYGLAELPVIVTDVGYCAEIVKHNKSGLVVKAEDSQMLFEALTVLTNDGSKRLEFSGNLKKTVQEFYSEKSSINNLIDIYNKLSL